MKKYLLAGGLAAVLVLGACGSEEDTEAEESAEFEEEATESEESDKGTRSNPYQVGETATVTVTEYIDGEDVEGTANITVDNILRGDDAMAEIDYEGRGNSHGQYEEDENLERMVFHMEYELTEFRDDDTPYEARARVLTYNADGEELPDDSIPNIQDDFDRSELYQGGTQSGQVNQLAPVEGPFLIKLVNEDVFFEVE